MSLANIQQAFHQAIYALDDTQLNALIVDDVGFPAHERIQVYRNNTLGTKADNEFDTQNRESQTKLQKLQ